MKIIVSLHVIIHLGNSPLGWTKFFIFFFFHNWKKGLVNMFLVLIALMYSFFPYDPHIKKNVGPEQKNGQSILIKVGKVRILELKRRKGRFLNSEKNPVICVSHWCRWKAEFHYKKLFISPLSSDSWPWIFVGLL